jgi:predicted O-methyltransferase YrrM
VAWHKDTGVVVLTELTEAMHAIAKEILGEAAIQEQLRTIVRARVEGMIAGLLRAPEDEAATKKKGK